MAFKRPPKIKTLRRIFCTDEPYAHQLAVLANKHRKSRKRKECYREIIRLNTPDHESDFVYFLAKTAEKWLHQKVYN